MDMVIGEGLEEPSEIPAVWNRRTFKYLVTARSKAGRTVRGLMRCAVYTDIRSRGNITPSKRVVESIVFLSINDAWN